MKFLSLAALALFLFTPTAQDVRTSYSEGQSLRVISHSTTTMELLSTTISFDGEEMPAGDVPEEAQVTVNRIEYVDSIQSVEDGRITALERSFELIEEEEDDGESQTSQSGVLEGRTIRIAEDEDGEVLAEMADDGDDIDARFLEGFTLRYDEEWLLPEDEVDVGDTWTIEGESARRYFGLLDQVNWFEEDSEEDEGPDFEALFAEEMDGEVDVTFVGTEEVDGQTVWAFSFELSMEGSIDGLSAEDVGMGGGDENPMADGEISLEAELSGEGTFAVGTESHCLVNSAGTGEVELAMAINTEMGAHTLLMELEMLIHLEGETQYELQ